jgi:hypothetical protein
MLCVVVLSLDPITAKEEEKKKLSACRGEGSVVGPLLAARALPLRCAASTVLSSALAMPNCGAQGAPAVWPYSSQRFLNRSYSGLSR